MEFDPDKLLADLAQHDSTSDMDNLMNELSAFESSASTLNAQSSSSNLDDLDSLMGQLGTPSKPSQPQYSSNAQMDDLDALMGELGSSPASRNPPPQNNSSNSGGMDDLDALMGSLGGSSSPARSSPAPQQRQPSAPQQRQPSSSGGMDELDDLMGSLGSSTPQQRQPISSTSSPAPQQRQPSSSGGMDELDALMGSLGGPSKPVQSSPAPQQRQPSAYGSSGNNNAGGMDELDALMGSLGGSPAPQQRQPSQPSAYGSSGNSNAGGMDELDALMGSLGGSPAPQQRQPSFNSNTSPYGSGGNTSPYGSGGAQMRSQSSFTQTTSYGGGRGNPQQNSPMGGRGRGMLPSGNSFDNIQGNAGRGFGRGANMQQQRGNTQGSGYAPRQPGQYPPSSPQGSYGSNRSSYGSSGGLDDLLGSLSEQMGGINDGSTASRGICGFCQKPILGECIQALGKKYHPDHFVCGSCQTPLGTSSFYETDGVPNCETCYNNMYCPMCGFCGKPISDRCVSAMGKKWHVDCFVCNSCCNPFQGGSFYEKNGMPYCQSCFQGTFATRCAGCGQVASGKIINAMNQQWHQQCFACSYCRRPFNGGPFYEKDGKPFCEAHYHNQSGNICDGCKCSIVGRCVDALGKKYHPEHFLCNYCMNPLSGGGYTEQNGKPYCQSCYANLF